MPTTTTERPPGEVTHMEPQLRAMASNLLAMASNLRDPTWNLHTRESSSLGQFQVTVIFRVVDGLDWECFMVKVRCGNMVLSGVTPLQKQLCQACPADPN